MSGATPRYLTSIECSAQPLDLSFHPRKDNLVAAALVDGTVEGECYEILKEECRCFTYCKRLLLPIDLSPVCIDTRKHIIVHDIHAELENNNNENDDASDDEHDSILSSLSIHTQRIPKTTSSNVKKNPGAGASDGGSSSSSAAAAYKTASCRAISFSSDGETMFTGGSAGDFVALNAERACTFSTPSSNTGDNHNDGVLWRINNATEKLKPSNSNSNAAMSSFYNPLQVVHTFGEQSSRLIATGDESGGVRLWDLRICGGGNNGKQTKQTTSKTNDIPSGCVLSWKEQDDYISGLEHSVNDCNTLLSTSADGRLGVFDIRMDSSKQRNNPRLSDDQEDELLSIKVIKNGKKVICGTHEGVLNVFSWGTWGDVSDRFPGHPSSIDALAKVDEDTLLTGSSDGLVRVVSIHPDKLLGVLEQEDRSKRSTIVHQGGEGFPIEKLQFNSNRHIVGSISHDNHIRLYNARVLDDSYDDEGDDDDEKGEDSKMPATESAAGASTKKRWSNNDSDGEWDDEDDQGKDDENDSDSDVDSDDDSDDDERAPTTNQKRAKRFKTDNEKFFADL